jgi:EcsC protein family
MIQCWQVGLTVNGRTLVGIFGKNDGQTGATTHVAMVGDSLAAGPMRVVERLMDAGIDGKGAFESARRVADVALAEHGDVERAIDAMVRSHLRLAAANGFVTSLGGFVVMPVALPVNVVGFYLLATRLVAGIAATRGYDIRQPAVRSAILLALVGADADDLLRKAGYAGSGRLVNLAAQQLPGPALMAINKGVAFRLLSQFGKKSLTRFGRFVPLAGGFVGASLDSYLLKRIADHARGEFLPKGHLAT